MIERGRNAPHIPERSRVYRELVEYIRFGVEYKAAATTPQDWLDGDNLINDMLRMAHAIGFDKTIILDVAGVKPMESSGFEVKRSGW